MTFRETPPKASVIVPTKNPGSVFREVLSAVLAQKTDFAFDVLVIDSGSTDGTAQYVRGLGDPRLRLMEIPPADFGHGKTRNQGIAATQGEYAVMITHDATPASDRWLAALVRTADQDEQIAGVFGRHLAYPQASPLTAHELELHFSGFLSQPVAWMHDKARYATDVGYRQFLHFFSDNNALVRRAVWEKIPYPEVDFAEDQIWARTVVESGWKKAYSHEAAVFHSHDYGLLDRFRRSFDESYAFLRFFGYKLCPSLGLLLRGWLALTRRDVLYLYSQRGMDRPALHFLRMPIDHFMRLAGHYFGTHGSRLPEKIRHLISRDRRMFSGLPFGKP